MVLSSLCHHRPFILPLLVPNVWICLIFGIGEMRARKEQTLNMGSRATFLLKTDLCLLSIIMTTE
jgi:hypothetical protein